MRRRLLNRKTPSSRQYGIEPLEPRRLLSTFVVTTTADSGTGSLRTAVASANSNSGADTITFDPAVFSLGSLHTITLTSGQLQLSGPTTITGPGQDVLAISGNHASRIFNISAPSNTTFSMSDLTFTDGSSADGGAIAITSKSTFTLTHCTFTSNSANSGTFGGGAIASEVASTLALNQCTLTGNSASNCFGGAILVVKTNLNVTECNISNNSSSPSGGAIDVDSSTAILSNCILSNNSAQGAGGAILSYVSGHDIAHTNPFVSASNCTFSGNTALNGGAIASNPLITLGPCTLSLNACTFSGNRTTSSSTTLGGGAIKITTTNSTITNCTFISNVSANVGGAVYASAGTLTATNCTITSNAANGINSQKVMGGGGICTESGAVVKLNNSIITANTTVVNAGKDIAGAFDASSSHNLISVIDTSSSGIVNGTNGNLAGTTAAPLNAKLSALANNGGATQTIALQSDSPAINAGDNSLSAAAGLTTDQRGYMRAVATVDIGAYEVNAVTAPDPFDSNKTSLFIAGSPLDDLISISRSSSNLSALISNTSGTTPYTFAYGALSGAIYCYGLAGNDSILQDSTTDPINLSLILDGGAGTDDLEIRAGTAAFSSDLSALIETMHVTNSAAVTFATTQHLAALNLDDATAQLSPGAGKVLVLNGLSILNSASLDLADNSLILDYTGPSPLSTIKSYLASGRGPAGFGNATWTGPGINSSTAAPGDGICFQLGYAENSDLPLGAYSTWQGQTVDGTAILIKYTRGGDSNLDGVVNDDDVTVVGATYNNPAFHDWYTGDFDYDGTTDDDDVTALGALYDPSAVPI